VRGGVARLAGQEMAAMPDEEKTFDELKARIAKTLAFIETINARNRLCDQAVCNPAAHRTRPRLPRRNPARVI
jgi:hypothetical protein